MLIPKWLFGAKITRLTDSEAIHYALAGVKLERNEETNRPTAVVTDGKRMLAVTWEERDASEHPCCRGFGVEGKQGEPELSGSHANPDFEAIVPMKSWDEAEWLMSKTGKAILQNVAVDENVGEDMRLLMVGTDGDSERSLKVKQLDGRFPKWQPFMSRLNDGNSVSIELNVRMLAGLAQVLGQIAEQESDYKAILRVPTNRTVDTAVSLLVSRADGAEAEGALNGLLDTSEELKARQKAVEKLYDLRARVHPANTTGSVISAYENALDVIAEVCSVGQINTISDKLLEMTGEQ